MLRSILFVAFVLTCFQSKASCLQNSDFNLVIDRQCQYNTTPCITVENVNYIEIGVNVIFRLESNLVTTGNSIVWKVDGGTVLSTSSFPSGLELIYQFLYDGPHTVEVVYDYNGSCQVVKSYSVDVNWNICTGISFRNDFLGTGCLGDESDLYFDSGTFLSSTWTFSDNVNGLFVLNGTNGVTLEHTNPSLTLESISVTQDMGTGVLCSWQATNNGSSCWQLQTVNYSDPVFECDQSVYFGQSLNVYFKGTQIYPDNDPTNHLYKLYYDDALIGSYAGLDYDDLLYTLSGFSGLGTHKLALHGGYDIDTDGDPECADSMIAFFEVLDPDLAPCFDCATFKPKAGEEYWISAWVKEDHATPVLTYADAHLRVDFDGTVNYETFYPSGEIIDGWQRIVGQFTIPSGTTDLSIQLKNDHSTEDAFFDDIRIHPFNASMKSYVYDPITLLLTAELDDNNYATFYEYDYEGKLIRIKKETARGIMTIQESRSSNPKTE